MKKNTIPLYMLIVLINISFFFYSPLSSADANEVMKYIYLSFDDGPLNGSARVDDAILTEQIPISVMLVGEQALNKPQDVILYKKNEYIEVGNHSYTHANNHYKLYYSKPKNVLADFIKNQKFLGLKDKIARLPGRNMWRIKGRSKNDINSGIEAANLLARNGFSLFGWDLEWRHDPHTGDPIGTAEDLLKKIEEKFSENRTFTQNHLILLSHDEMFKHTYEESELKRLIKMLKNRKNYKFERLRNYP